MEEVECGAASEQELVPELLVDSAEQVDEAKDGLERSSAEAALAGDAGEVAAIGNAVHAASEGAARRWVGTIRFQRLMSFPPRVPASR